MNPTTPHHDDDPDDVLAALERLEVTEAALRLRLRRRFGVSNTDIVALQHIDRASRRSRGISATDLAPVLGISVPAVAALTKRLEARGLLVKQQAAGARGVRLLLLSEQAATDLLDAMRSSREKLQGVVDELGDLERRRTVATLDRIVDALDGGAPLAVPTPSEEL